jgi:NADPH:quinone reductase-like Zn-dependent oxidoreductase
LVTYEKISPEKEFLEAGKIMPMIDACYQLSIAAKAFWYFEKEHARGKVIITVED